MTSMAASGAIEAAVDEQAIAPTLTHSTNDLTVPVDKKKKQRPWSKGKRVDSVESDDGTNTTATKTGDVNGNGKDGGKEKSKADLEKELYPPVSMGALYRFSTPFELFTGAIGLVAALGAGAAQVSFTRVIVQLNG